MNKCPTFGDKQVGPIFSGFFPYELLVSGFCNSHLNNQEVVDKPSDVQKKTRLSGITVKFQGRGWWNSPFGAPGMGMGGWGPLRKLRFDMANDFSFCGEFYLLCFGGKVNSRTM